MKLADNSLPNDTKLLKQLVIEKSQLAREQIATISDQAKRIQVLEEAVTCLHEQFRLSQHKQYAPSTEVDHGQGNLFNEAEVIVDELDIPDEDKIVSLKDSVPDKPKGKSPVRKTLPKDLPRESVLHDIADPDKICNTCDHDLHKIGEDIREELVYVPAVIKVREHVHPKYGCRHCERHGAEVSIVQQKSPFSLFAKSFVTPSLLAHIMISKYQYALPLYRQSTWFNEYGIDLSRQTMSLWIIKYTPLLVVVYERLKYYLLKQGVIQADETTLKVILVDKSTCYMWLYCTGADSPSINTTDIPNIVVYDFQTSRSGKHAQKFLSGYTGYLQVDGYQGYTSTSASLVGCWAHTRRKFKEAEAVLSVKQEDSKIAWALKHIQKLYRIEKQIKELSPSDKQAYREEYAKPLLDEYKQWLDNTILQVLPKSALGKAIAYSIRQWPHLVKYIDDGRLAIDNNRSERAIKPFVIGRKNWLFANTVNGANASATIYSIIETAKANNLVPFKYLQFLLEKLTTGDKEINIDDLLPWNVKL
jgi:transposase